MKPQISLIVATYNSADRIEKLRRSLASQRDASGSPWGDRLEVLCIDGGSEDSTQELAREVNWAVIANPAGDPVSAKVIGWEMSTSDFVVFLDHDEIFVRNDSLARKFALLSQNSQIVASFSSGYSLEVMDASDAYLSEYGDAFSCFAYKSRNVASGKLPRTKGLVRISEDRDAVVLQCPTQGSRSLVELAVQATMASKSRLALAVGHARSDGQTLLRVSGLIDLEDWACFAILKDDPIQHEPQASWSTIRAKGKWRLHNNLKGTRTLGATFRGREGERTASLLLVFFGLHILTILPLLLRSIFISVRSRKNYLFGHLYLTFALLIDALLILGGREQGRYGS